MLLLKIFIFIFFFLILINCTPTGDSMSHLGENINQDYTPIEVRKNIEQIYKEHMNFDEATQLNSDPVCTLSNTMKIALCNLIYKLQYYQAMKMNLNNVAHYFAKLTCEKNKLSFNFIPDFKENAQQIMYPCHGRHDIVHTSFIEDDYYDKIFLSAGPYNNSVAVYICLQPWTSTKSYILFDYIYNVDLLKLQDIYISKNEVIQELNLNKQIFLAGGFPKALPLYKKEQYLKTNTDDPICDLEYGKKISLCNIIFEKYFKTNILPIQLNKSATFIYSMSCLIKSIYEIKQGNEEILLQEKQKLYPCYGRTSTETSRDKFFVNKYLHTFFLSSGSTRNSVFLYVRTRPAIDKEIFNVFDLIGNIDFKHLKPTILTVDDAIQESGDLNFKLVQNVINKTELHHRQKLLAIIESSKSETEQYKKIESKMPSEGDLFSILIKMRDKSHLIESEYFEYFLTKENSNIENIGTSTPFSVPSLIEVSYVTNEQFQAIDFFLVGSQVYKRLLQKIKAELITSSPYTQQRERIRRKLAQRSESENSIKNQRMKDINELINKMQICATMYKTEKESSIKLRSKSMLITEVPPQQKSNKKDDSEEKKKTGKKKKKKNKTKSD